MKKIISLLIILSASTSIAQNRFVLTGNIPIKGNSKVFLVYPQGDRQITDSAMVTNGRFSMSGILDYPVQSRIFLHKNPYVTKLAKGEVMDYLICYLEPVAFQLHTKDSLKNSYFVNSAENEAFLNLKQMLQRYNSKYAALRKEFEALPKEKQKDSTVLAGFIAREEVNSNESYLIHLEFARKHPSSYVALNSLAHVAAQPGFSEDAKKVYDQLPVALKNSPVGKGVLPALSAEANTKIGAMAVDIEQSDVSGKPIKLSDFKGKYLLLDFWASWCGPCREENPNLVAAYQKYKAQGFEIFGVSLDQPGQRDAWIAAIKEDQLTWTQVSDLRGWENAAGRAYGIRFIPANFFIDPSGKIIAKDLKGKEFNVKLKEIFGH